MWYRIFGSNDASVAPAAFLEHLRGQGHEVSGNFRGDDHGWFHVDLRMAGEETPLELDRYLATEEGIRGELNSWAAWLETVPSPNQQSLMLQLIQTKQVFTISRTPDQDRNDPVEELCLAICRFLAGETSGVYQMDGRGFFAAHGELLLAEG
jgi:hypothetical protein